MVLLSSHAWFEHPKSCHTKSNWSNLGNRIDNNLNSTFLCCGCKISYLIWAHFRRHFNDGPFYMCTPTSFVQLRVSFFCELTTQRVLVKLNLPLLIYTRQHRYKLHYLQAIIMNTKRVVIWAHDARTTHEQNYNWFCTTQGNITRSDHVNAFWGIVEYEILLQKL